MIGGECIHPVCDTSWDPGQISLLPAGIGNFHYGKPPRGLETPMGRKYFWGSVSKKLLKLKGIIIIYNIFI